MYEKIALDGNDNIGDGRRLNNVLGGALGGRRRARDGIALAMWYALDG